MKLKLFIIFAPLIFAVLFTKGQNVQHQKMFVKDIDFSSFVQKQLKQNTGSFSILYPTKSSDGMFLILANMRDTIKCFYHIKDNFLFSEFDVNYINKYAVEFIDCCNTTPKVETLEISKETNSGVIYANSLYQIVNETDNEVFRINKDHFFLVNTRYSNLGEPLFELLYFDLKNERVQPVRIFYRIYKFTLIDEKEVEVLYSGLTDGYFLSRFLISSDDCIIETSKTKIEIIDPNRKISIAIGQMEPIGKCCYLIGGVSAINHESGGLYLLYSE